MFVEAAKPLCWLFDTELTLANANHAIVIANKPSTVTANNGEVNATLNTNKNSPYLISFHNTLDNDTYSIEHKPYNNEITSTSLFANKVITTTFTLATTTLSTTNNTALNLSISRVVHQTHDIPQIPPYIRNTAMSFCIIILLLGVIGNVMVPVVIIRTKDMRNSTNIFLTNLSIADLLVLLVCTPTVLVELNTKPETWALGPEMSKRLISNKGLMMRLRPTKPELSLKARNQVVLMLGAVVLSFFLCLLPFRLLTLWIILDSEQSLYAIGIESYYKLLYFCRIMIYLNSAINPILYNLMSTKFRKGFYKLIHTVWNCVFTLISCDQRARRKRSNTNTTATANTSSNTGTTTTQQNTSSSILSRSSNRCASEDGDTRSRKQLNVQPPFGADSEMATMLNTNKDDCPAATILAAGLPPFKLCALRKNRLSSPLPAASLSQHNSLNSQQLKATKQISFEEVVETEDNA
uniref:G-protein coupled receptors family 1 profile domain-containing protein n=1 Tax=Glossina palpalis gambiensis TaxID=67801 RepID=A0A1B0C006_9MUSC